MSEPARSTTRIEGGTIVAFDGERHRLLENGVLSYRGDTIVHVGRENVHAADRVIDARGKLVIPGQISTHAHVGTHDGARPITDGGRRDFLRSGFLNFLPTKFHAGPPLLAPADPIAAARYGMACLLRNGVTTAVAFAPGGADGGTGMLDLAEEMGLRLYFAPMSTGGRYHFDDSGRLHEVRDERQGLEDLDRAAQFIERYDGAHDGLVRGALVIDEYHFATPATLRRAKELAVRLGVPLTLHFVEQVWEFHQTLRATGKTPVELLQSEGFLGPEVILAHCIYVAGHRATAYPYGDDLALIALAGASVAHSPLAFARRGAALESFERYLAAGINMAIGTDIFPMDMFAEMRTASMVGKLVEQNHEVARAVDVFNASNIGGARALNRDDLGRLAPGAKADIVLVDWDNLTIGPLPDPIRALVHLATPEMVDTVVVNGRTVVENGRLTVCDQTQVLTEARASCARVWAAFPQYHWSGRSIAEEYPPSLKPWIEPE